MKITHKMLAKAIKLIAHYFRAFSLRFDHWEETIDLKKRGNRFPKDTIRSIWREPSEVADYIDLSIFFDADEK